MNTRRARQIAGLVVATLLLATAGAQAQFSLLHSFAGGSDGCFPPDSLTLDGATLYGITYGDVSGTGSGTVFKLAIPEPATMGLMALLSGGLLALRRLRRWRT